MFGIPIIWLVVLWCLLCICVVLRKAEKKSTGAAVKYFRTITCRSPLSRVLFVVRNAIEGQLGFEAVEGGNDDRLVFQRRKEHVFPDGVDWHHKGVTLTVTFVVDSSSVHVTLLFETNESVQLSKYESARFDSNAVNAVNLLWASLSSSNADDEEDEDEHTHSVEEDLADDDHVADFVRLGLESDASREEVKKAYRRLCLKYHPDTLASNDLPEHIEALAVERFRDITDAYRRLRQFHGE